MEIFREGSYLALNSIKNDSYDLFGLRDLSVRD
jgi:hypothetical protein